ncbi:hypothetical protein FAZ19_00590 [Sphingobacterium alkalisoli]|uniref:Type IV secretion system putative lipoprotein virB7 n=1 Tax=Sphingobacterium alkalisoli TaxID=1874115 RepID=A0A4U0H7X7_9SPHI|nr:lipoprotein [Sphingobacterium alkalisoli]TJY67796.1 hypothetical protein FAZ19_00590 [Sphingobacterium alkalisoli]GGH11317.1 hypothetical protein GCM10011418_10090 [Sphingobacterium alkalisoli]
MKKSIFFLLVALALASCQSKEGKIFSFVEDFNNSEIVNPLIKQSKAYYINKREANIDFIFNAEDSVITNDILKKSFSSILGQVINAHPDLNTLVNDGVIFNLRIFNQFGTKVIESPLNKDNIKDLNVF